MNAAYVSVDPEWNRILERWMRTKLRCARCGVDFFEIKNLGRWQCFQHASFVVDHGTGKWPCCGRVRRNSHMLHSVGCVRADHTTLPIPFNEGHDMPLPKAAVRLIQPHKEAIVPLSESCPEESASTDPEDYYATVVVRRFDACAADRRGRLDPGCVKERKHEL